MVDLHKPAGTPQNPSHVNYTPMYPGMKGHGSYGTKGSTPGYFKGMGKGKDKGAGTNANGSWSGGKGGLSAAGLWHHQRALQAQAAATQAQQQQQQQQQQQTKSAALQAKRLAAANKVAASETDSQAPTPTVGDLELASQHLMGVASAAVGCPGVSCAAGEKADALRLKAFAARPLSQQVEMLSAQMQQKEKLHQKLLTEIQERQERCTQVYKEGQELDSRLQEAKAKLASAPVHASPSTPDAANAPLEAIRQVAHMAGVLPPEISASFVQCLSLLQKFASEHCAAVAAAQPQSYLDVVSGACGAVAPAAACGVLQAPAGPPAPLWPAGATVAAAQAPLGTVGFPHVLGATQVAPAFGGVDLTSSPPPLISPALAAVSRGRRMGVVVSSASEVSEAEDFIPVGRRSRSAPGRRRLRQKTPDSEATASMETELMDGARYFSRLASEHAVSH